MADDVRQSICDALHDAGACRVGFASASAVDPSTVKRYAGWIAAGNHADMSYLDRYGDVRSDPRLLLEGATTVICCAFDYRQPQRHSLFADYALGEDYHDVIRRRLTAAADKLCSRFGGSMRVCVDTAPILERYWASRAGLGVIGLNGLLIVDGIGSKVFLAEIIWTGYVEPDRSRLGEACMRCGACLKACPGHALLGDSTLDARRCHSYLTIEHRGELPPYMHFGNRIYGCDICQDACPHNRTEGHTSIAEFTPSAELMHLTLDSATELTQDSFRHIFRHSAVRRAKLTGFVRNARFKAEQPPVKLQTGAGARGMSVRDVNNPELPDGIKIVMPTQTHTANVAIYDGTTDTFPDTDAIITRLPGVAVGVRTADCVPVILHATDIKAVAAIHAGWKGTINGIVAATIDRLIDMGASPANIRAAFGPSICGNCYETGSELGDKFSAAGYDEAVIRNGGTDPSTGEAFGSESIRIDLMEANCIAMLRCGLKPENITRSSICTRHSAAQWPSWRRVAQTSERLATFVWLTDQDF